jgi:hypothetical protein
LPRHVCELQEAILVHFLFYRILTEEVCDQPSESNLRMHIHQSFAQLFCQTQVKFSAAALMLIKYSFEILFLNFQHLCRYEALRSSSVAIISHDARPTERLSKIADYVFLGIVVSYAELYSSVDKDVEGVCRIA